MQLVRVLPLSKHAADGNVGRMKTAAKRDLFDAENPTKERLDADSPGSRGPRSVLDAQKLAVYEPGARPNITTRLAA